MRTRWVGGPALVALLATCGQEAPEPSPEAWGAPSAPAAPVAVTEEPSAPSGPKAVPDSVLVRTGACPYECCEFGPWVASVAIPVAADDRSVSDTVFTLQPGESFTAVTGTVHVTDMARVVVVRPALQHGSRGRTFEPGDTLALLDYMGEGYHNVWYEGEVMSVEGFWVSEDDWDPDLRFEGYSVGRTRTEWWVQAENAEGLRGWFEVIGANADMEGPSPCAC